MYTKLNMHSKRECFLGEPIPSFLFIFSIRSLREAGLLETWYRSMTSSLYSKSQLSQVAADSESLKPFGMQELGIAFIFLLAGALLSLSAFVSEMVMGRLSRG